MKKLLCGALCAVLLFGAVLTGCESRDAQPAPESVSAHSEPESNAATSTPVPAPQETSAPESKPEFPAPELTDAEKKMLEENLHQFIAYFGETENATPEKLDQEQLLSFCLVQTFRQKDLLAYFFEQNEKGDYLIPDSLISDEAARLFDGIEGFRYPDSTRYDADAKAYRYAPGGEATLPNYAISELRGGGEDTVYWEVDFFTPENKPLRTATYTFHLRRLNGMPYLQLLSIQTKA